MTRKCTCGFTKFYRVAGSGTSSEIEAWLPVDVEVVLGSLGQGHGTTPYGTLYGTGLAADSTGDGFALVRAPYAARTEAYRCDSCDRARSETIVGGTALFGGYYDEAAQRFYFVVNEITDLANFSAHVVADTEAVDVVLPLFVGAGPVPNDTVPIHAVLEVTDTLPPGGAVVTGLFYADLSSLPYVPTDTYEFFLVDATQGTETLAGTAEISPPVPWSISGLYTWHAGDDVTLVGSDVDVFTDKSGNARHLTAAASGDRPLYVASGINGRPVARFDGAANFMSWTADFATDLAAGSEVFLISQSATDPPLTTTETGVWDVGSTTQVNYHPYTDGIYYTGWGSTTRQALGASSHDAAQPNVMNVVSVSGEYTARHNGSPLFTTETNVVGFDGAPRFGVSHGNANFFDGDVAEILIFEGKLSMADRSRVHGYLNNRYGLTLPVEVPEILGAVEWWDASSGITEATGVSDWVGRIASSTVSQAAGGNQPGYEAAYSGWNGPALTFNGSTNLLAGAASLAAGASDYTVGFTVDQTALNNGYLLDVSAGRLIFTANHSGLGPGANSLAAYDGTWEGISALGTTGNQSLVYTGENAVGRTIRKDGVEIDSAVAFVQRALAGTWSIGGLSGTLFTGAMRDVVVYDRKLSAADLADHEAWAAGRVT